jgi:hypothetical protein
MPDFSNAECGFPNSPNQFKAYAIVDDLLARQDVVLVQLDELNARVETAIQMINEARKVELEFEETNIKFAPQAEFGDALAGQSKAA